jgi:hypothetical protein
MATQPKTITLTWRNENYGPVYDAFAFRTSIDPFPSETLSRQVAVVYRKAGFQLHMNRQAWIAEDKLTSEPDLPLRITSLLEDKGFIVRHAGAVPSILREAMENDEMSEGAQLKM